MQMFYRFFVSEFRLFVAGVFASIMLHHSLHHFLYFNS